MFAFLTLSLPALPAKVQLDVCPDMAHIRYVVLNQALPQSIEVAVNRN